VEDFRFDAPKTREFQAILQALQVADKKPLTVLANYDKMLYLSCRNLPAAAITPAQDLSTYDLLKAGSLVVTESAIEKIKEFCA
jgi:large subunit ribosomal protein L4